MEVFMHNVPEDLTDKSLAMQLQSSMEALDIRDWKCEKVRRRRIATITFLDAEEGLRFRRQHEQALLSATNAVGKPQYKARLNVAGSEVYCMLSNKKPNSFLIKAMAKSAEDRARVSKEKRPKAEPVDENIVFATKTLSCGSYRYVDEDLVYFPEIEWQTGGGLAKFLKQTIVITYEDPQGPKRVEIPFRTIENVIVSAKSHALTITLWESPRFYHVQSQQMQEQIFAQRSRQAPVKTRLTGLTEDPNSHRKIMGQALMEALVRNGYLLPSTAEGLLEKLALSPRAVSDAAIKDLFKQLPFAGTEVDASVFDIDELWEYMTENEAKIKASLLKPLITFCEEDGTDLRLNSSESNDKVYERFKAIMTTGINICGRVFGFLGFSHSSLRSHAAWFMATFYTGDNFQSYISVIKWLGDFDDIRSPARCAARIGQAFSETPLAVNLPENNITTREIPDVRVVSNGVERAFSDAVGLVSPSALDSIHKMLPNQNSQPTCFQIRWGGAKGMISLHTPLEGDVMLYRPSMVKFESRVINNLEICDLARKPLTMMLNRQLVKILEDMGVSFDWFSARQQETLHHLRMLTAHIVNTVKYLQRQKIADSIGFPQLIRRLEDIGASYKHDSFLRSLIETLILRELRLLKHKARIEIEEGVTLFGIMDETGYLKEGEVFVTFDKSPSRLSKTSFLDLKKRKIIVTRSPALHPGDIQLARNVLPPVHHPLRAHRNCIIFSQRGQRDLPSCLSGGDLDGDIYNIIWDQHAVGECTSVHEPADYARVSPLTIDRPVTREDMSDFFVKFMATDQLGLIAVKHMIFVELRGYSTILADRRDAGTVDNDCKTLAEMHSTGVDYSKTGIPIKMSQLRGLKIDHHRPDFLASAPVANIKNRTEIVFDAPTAPSAIANTDEEDTVPSHSYYKSDKALGQLYRAIDEKEVWYDNVKSKYLPNFDIWTTFRDYVRDKLRYCSVPDYSEHASKTLIELEFFTGNIFNKTGSQTPRQRDKSMKLKDEFDRITKWSATMMRRRDLMVLDEDEDEQASQRRGSDEAMKLCLACLDVGRMEDPKKKRSGMEGRAGSVWESFKVVAACCVVKELDAALWRADNR